MSEKKHTHTHPPNQKIQLSSIQLLNTISVQILWTYSIYLEAGAILPQLFMMSKTGEAETITRYIVCYNIFRELYALNLVDTGNRQFPARVARVLWGQTASHPKAQTGWREVSKQITVAHYILHTVLYHITHLPIGTEKIINNNTLASFRAAQQAVGNYRA